MAHISATYYATKLNRQELCYRYGWKFSSNMPAIYISRAGMETKQLDERFAQTELNAVKSVGLRVAPASDLRVRITHPHPRNSHFIFHHPLQWLV